MTTIAPLVDTRSIPDPPSGPVWLLRDSWTEAIRHLKALPRNPELLVFAALQPIMFVVLFVYVFGGSINVPGYSSYEQYVIPGIFAQTVLFGSIYTGLGIAEDLTKGFIDRLRSLPMYSSAMLLGRTISDVVRNALSFVGDARGRVHHRVPLRGLAARGCGCDAAPVPLRVRVQLDPGVHRPRRRLDRGRQLDRVPLDVRRHLHLVGVRRTGEHARLAAADRRAQPGDRSSPTRAARSTTAATPAPTRGSRSRGRSASRSSSPRCRSASTAPRRAADTAEWPRWNEHPRS